MINNYKEGGNGAEYLSPITLATIKLAAAMFVDNADLFFSGKTGVPEDNFLAMVQEHINKWANIMISTGGNIKIAKSHAKVSIPMWSKGHCKTRHANKLPPVFYGPAT